MTAQQLLQSAKNDLAKSLTQNIPETNRVPLLLDLIAAIQVLVGEIDVYDLDEVPLKTVETLGKHIKLAARPIDEFMLNAYPKGEQFKDGVGRPEVHELNDANVNRHKGQLNDIYSAIYDLATPVLTRQSIRRIETALSRQIKVCHGVTVGDSSDEETLWKYMPLRNFLRCVKGGGVWLSSLEKLAEWSRRGIADTKEGDIPPVVTKIREEGLKALSGGGGLLDDFKQRYNCLEKTPDEIRLILNASCDKRRVFACSLALRPSEDAGLWYHYGDRGTGVALRTTITKSVGGSWKLPFYLSGGYDGTICESIMMRRVHYLKWNDEDRLDDLSDLFIPFCKRRSFQSETEVRLLGFTDNQTDRPGFILRRNLCDVLDEIVVGPHADFEAVASEIQECSPWVENIPMKASDLRGP